MTQYAAAIVFPDNATTYQAYSTIKNTANSLGVTAAAIVERDASGAIKVTEGEDSAGGTGIVSGSLIGMLIGVLGGPLGVLLGATAGAAGGALFDASHADDTDDAITEFAKRVPAGHNAILAETEEADTTALDALVK